MHLFDLDIHGDRVPVLVEIGFCVLEDLVELVEGDPLDEEGVGVLFDLHQLGDMRVVYFADGIILIDPVRGNVAVGQGLVEGFVCMNIHCLFDAENAAVDKRTLIGDGFAVGDSHPSNAGDWLIIGDLQCLGNAVVDNFFDLVDMHVNDISLLQEFVAETEGSQAADHLFFGDKSAHALHPNQVALADQIIKGFSNRGGRDTVFFL